MFCLLDQGRLKNYLIHQLIETRGLFFHFRLSIYVFLVKWEIDHYRTWFLLIWQSNVIEVIRFQKLGSRGSKHRIKFYHGCYYSN